jgi:F-type H+-transporting ATPase subunit b
MPQLESQYFLSQIFWFVICFTIIYLTIRERYIPKVKEILKKREEKQDLENYKLKKAEDEINAIAEKNIIERKNLALRYNQIINETRTKIAKKREKELLNIEKKVIDLNANSAQLVKNFQEQYSDDSAKISQSIKEKILNKLS